MFITSSDQNKQAMASKVPQPLQPLTSRMASICSPPGLFCYCLPPLLACLPARWNKEEKHEKPVEASPWSEVLPEWSIIVLRASTRAVCVVGGGVWLSRISACGEWELESLRDDQNRPPPRQILSNHNLPRFAVRRCGIVSRNTVGNFSQSRRRSRI